jgi:prepilin-type N-terminal cleavage/methylation domain-containing protein
MRVYWMKKLMLSQKGMTLVELIMAMAVTLIIALAIGWAIFHVFNLNTKNTNDMTAVSQVQSVGYWVTHDTVMAQSDNLTITDQSGNVVTSCVKGIRLSLTWLDSNYPNVNVLHKASYTWNSNARTISREMDGQATVIAQHIKQAEFSNCDGKVFLTVTAEIQTRYTTDNETRTYEILPRVSGS